MRKSGHRRVPQLSWEQQVLQASLSSSSAPSQVGPVVEGMWDLSIQAAHLPSVAVPLTGPSFALHKARVGYLFLRFLYEVGLDPLRHTRRAPHSMSSC